VFHRGSEIDYRQIRTIVQLRRANADRPGDKKPRLPWRGKFGRKGEGAKCPNWVRKAFRLPLRSRFAINNRSVFNRGRVAEWFKAPVLKTGRPVRVS
jgi:hypothetical protein